MSGRPELRRARFFLFSFALGNLFCYCQQVIDNNFMTARSTLWIFLMIGIPLGAACYHRCRAWLAPRAASMVWWGWLWLLAGNALVVRETRHDRTLPVPRIPMIMLAELAKSLLCFLPLWMACGAMELALYESLADASQEEQRRCYVLGLSGLLASVVCYAYALPSPSPCWLGVLAVAGFFVFALAGRGLRLIDVVLVLAVLGACARQRLYVAGPAAYFPEAQASATVLLHDEWTRLCRFSLIRLRDGDVLGAYDSFPHWLVSSGPRHERYPFVPKGAAIALLGAGGGSQLPALLSREPSSIDAVDIVPSIPSVMRTLGDGAWSDPRVRTAVMDGRKFLAAGSRTYDVILIPFVESTLHLAQTMFDPADHLFSLQAMRLYSGHLAPGGLLFIEKSAIYSGPGSIVDNYAATMRRAGFVVAYRDEERRVALLGAKDARVLATVARPPWRILYGESPGTVLDDSRPFLASIFFSRLVIAVLWGCFALCVCLVALLSKRLTGSRPAAAPLLCGIGSTFLSLLLQVFIFFRAENPLEAGFVGSVAFLAVTASGALLADKPIVLGAAMAVGALAAAAMGAPALGLTAALCLGTGPIFPALIHRYRDRLAALLIMDELGAALGGALYTLVVTALGLPAALGTGAALAAVLGAVSLTGPVRGAKLRECD